VIRIVVADDHPVVRDGLRTLFDSLPDTEVIGEAGTGREAIRAAVAQRPDVLIMDLGMPDVDGFAATAEISRVAPGVAVLILTMSDDDETVFTAMRAGARGYLVKGATKEEIIRAVTAVAAGEAIFGPDVARRVLSYFSAAPQRRDPFPQLTPREREVLDLLAGGLSNATIAARLGLSLKTVNNNTSSIFAKLQVAGRAEAIVRAREAGLGRGQSLSNDRR
jgi:DNA-binding NarL/FixJ family response regulator